MYLFTSFGYLEDGFNSEPKLTVHYIKINIVKENGQKDR